MKNIVTERNLMSEEEFQEYIEENSSKLKYNDYLNKFKHYKRACRRGHMLEDGTLFPNKPFNNRKNTCKRGKDSRAFNSHKKKIYEEIKE